jgi:micrococcal nuclease
VERVIDGDTVLLASGERVRLLGIDTPEHDAPLFEEARRACAGLVNGRRIRLAVSPIDARDGYGRLLALVYTGDLLVNEALVARGLARIYRKAEGEMPLEVERRMIQAQVRAIDLRVGLWADPGALHTRPGEVLLATRYRYHRQGCPSLASGPPSHPRAGVTREWALRTGRSPCRTCNPGRRPPVPARGRRSPRACIPSGAPSR